MAGPRRRLCALQAVAAVPDRRSCWRVRALLPFSRPALRAMRPACRMGCCRTDRANPVFVPRRAPDPTDVSEQAEKLRRRARRLYRKRLAEVVVAQWKRVAHGRLTELRARKCHERQARKRCVSAMPTAIPAAVRPVSATWHEAL